jgi:hypothetical protein
LRKGDNFVGPVFPEREAGYVDLQAGLDYFASGKYVISQSISGLNGTEFVVIGR